MKYPKATTLTEAWMDSKSIIYAEDNGFILDAILVES
jgi:hypothetical protein